MTRSRRSRKLAPLLHSLGRRLEVLEDRTVPSAFNLANFGNTTGISLVGDVSTTADQRLRLTPAQVYKIGAAWFTAEKPIVAGNFETTFRFQLNGGSDGANGGAEGFVFLIQNTSPNELYAPGGNLGYERMPNSVAVEFDTQLNVTSTGGDPINDPSANHISVHTNGTGPNSANEALSLGSFTTLGSMLDDGQVHTAKVAYTPGTLRVYLDNLTTPVLTVSLDLATKLNLDNGRAWVGFTAATARATTGYQNHDILSWSFQGDDNLILADRPSVLEGASASTFSANFTIRRLGSLTGQAVVNWATANGTATAGTDYVAASGQVVFQDGEAQQTVAVTVTGDRQEEAHETFELVLSNATPGYTASSGLATILNDDTSVSVSDASAVEGDASIRFMDDFVSANSGGLFHTRGAVFGPDGDLYVTSYYTHQVLHYDGATGAFRGVFVSSRSGGLEGPWAMTFGPDGNNDGVSDLYVGGNWSSNVVRYDGLTGALIDVFDPTGSSGLVSPKGLAFDSQGNLYVSGGIDNPQGRVWRFRSDGTFRDVFVANGSGGLQNPGGLAFGPDGNLYVAHSNGVSRDSGTTGAFLGAFVAPGSGGMNGPLFLAFRPNGYLYASSQGTNEIIRYDAANGAFVDRLFPAGSGGLIGPFCFAFDADGYVVVCSDNTHQVLRYGPATVNTFAVRLSSPSAVPVTVSVSSTDGTALAGSDYEAVSNRLVTFAPGETKQTVLVRTLDNTVVEATETFTLTLSNSTGATIADGIGVATILDNDATKFFVVNDGPDQTYRYGAPGNALGNSALGSGNTAPRGAASTAAGTKVWVVDANKTVYVYNPTGGQLGSWSAGGLNGSAQVEGIATNGTDIWLLDAKQDKVYKYAGAASRLSGSQNAASSFNLATGLFGLTGNTNPKGLVTDGSSIWVVDDGSGSDRVFKYSLSGTSLGNWTIDAVNSSPTGLTINPASVSDIWIVDSGTDKVYQYTAAAGRISGSQTASATFALAAGNTNPQDIADPPAISIDDAAAMEGDTSIRFIDDFVSAGSGGITGPREILFGPDGYLYVASGTTGQSSGDASNLVARYDARTGAFVDVAFSAADSGVFFDLPWAMTFGPDNRLYVGGRRSNNILRYDPATDTVVELIPPGGKVFRPAGIAFGPDGNLYVSNSSLAADPSPLQNQVVRFQGPTSAAPGQFIDVFIPSGDHGLNNNNGIAFSGDSLFVANNGGRNIHRYERTTGAFLAASVPVSNFSMPVVPVYGSDGFLYVGDQGTNQVNRFNASTGALVNAVMPSGSGGLSGTVGLAFDAVGNLYVASTPTRQVLRYGPSSQMAFTVRLSEPSAAPVNVQFATAHGAAIAGSDYSSATNTMTFSPGQTTRTILVQTKDDAQSEPAETFTINLSNPVGATIADGQAVGTILDNEPAQVASAAVNGGALQRSRVTDLTVSFTGLVNLPANPADAFQLTRTGPGVLNGDLTLSVDLSGSTATQTVARLTFGGSLTQAGSLVDGTYTLTVLGSQVTGNGQPLDGDADGTPGGDFAFNLHRLFGDANGDRVVNGSDLTPFIQQFGGPNPTFDFNGDGVVNGADLTEFVKNFGRGF